MKYRRIVLGLIIFFLMISVAFAPIAFRNGIAFGQGFNATLSDFGADQLVIAATRPLNDNDCPDLGQPGGFTRPGAVIDCVTSHDSENSTRATTVYAAIPAQTRRRSTPATFLRDEVAAALANGVAGDAKSAPDDPLSLAMASTASDAGGGDGSAFGGGLGGGPGLPGSGGFLNNPTDTLIPDVPPLPGQSQTPPGSIFAPPASSQPPGPSGPGFGPEQPSGDIPELVTPIPPGLALMLTGLIGFFTAVRYK